MQNAPSLIKYLLFNQFVFKVNSYKGSLFKIATDLQRNANENTAVSYHDEKIGQIDDCKINQFTDVSISILHIFRQQVRSAIRLLMKIQKIFTKKRSYL